MDKFIFQLGDWSCTIFDKVGLDQLTASQCGGYDSEYALGAWTLIGALMVLVAPVLARNARDFLLASGKAAGEKE